MPHHNMVAGQRAQFFSQLGKKFENEESPETVILVSPNHYYAGQSKIQTADKEWKLGEGSINSNKTVIQNLVTSGLATNEPASFTDEHGIYTIFPDIHKTFPNAQIVPIILKDVSRNQINKLAEVLNNSCKRCLMITSVDFSHYQPAMLAELHDDKSIYDLQTLDAQDLMKDVEVDSGPALALLTIWAQQHKTPRFNLLNHTNSDLLLNNPDLEGTSHIYGWYERGLQVKPENFVSFISSSAVNFGNENRTIWGTDLIFKDSILESADSSKTIVAGKVFANRIEFFALPVDPQNPAKLLSGVPKQEALRALYEPYKNNLVSTLSGDLVRISNTNILPLNNLSTEVIQSTIKGLININP